MRIVSILEFEGGGPKVVLWKEGSTHYNSSCYGVRTHLVDSVLREEGLGLFV